ncbi:unnamed protein product [Cuscuta campestris]|uniref:Uncharacterized protein n=1 Tax=Cuscuta campestris TaxID=132261 RepID=A0A484MM24_9ASTE|nr:unnamed protein product [Cuscuta campestris]VFQ89101.1 unnamed protein product [Cuscuta campestris]
MLIISIITTMAPRTLASKVQPVGEVEEDKRLPSISSELLEHDIEMVIRESTPSSQGQNSILEGPVEDIEEAKRKPSISSDLLEHDIGLATRSEQGHYSYLDSNGEIDEETETLFQPVFQVYFEALFKEVENQLKEALAKKVLFDDLKKGLLRNQHGKASRATRETVRSMEIVSMINIEGAKYPVFLSCSTADKDTVAEFFSVLGFWLAVNSMLQSPQLLAFGNGSVDFLYQ